MSQSNHNPYKAGTAMELLHALPPTLGAKARLTALVLWGLAQQHPEKRDIAEPDLRKITKLTYIGQSDAVDALRDAAVLTPDGWFISPWLRNRRTRLLPVQATHG